LREQQLLKIKQQELEIKKKRKMEEAQLQKEEEMKPRRIEENIATEECLRQEELSKQLEWRAKKKREIRQERWRR